MLDLFSNISFFVFSGWIMQMCRFLYIDRCWKSDETRMGNMINHLASTYNKHPCDISQSSQKQTSHNRNSSNFQIVLFPEGTNINEKSLAKSHRFADRSNFKRLSNVLHPRTTGFSFLATKMRECK